VSGESLVVSGFGGIKFEFEEGVHRLYARSRLGGMQSINRLSTILPSGTAAIHILG